MINFSKGFQLSTSSQNSFVILTRTAKIVKLDDFSVAKNI
jgi:hypothetical protein